MAVSPTEQGRVGSAYGERVSSRTGRRTFHAGWDFVAPRHTPIYAAESGVVERINTDRPTGSRGGYGNSVVVRHGDDTWALYAHLQTMNVAQGSEVRAGDQIGTAGNTTNGKFPRMPPHLHFEIRHARSNGSSPFPGRYGQLNLDPLDWFRRKGLNIGNRHGRPPGTLMGGGSLGELGLGGRIPEWWETTFPQRAPAGSVYEPGVEMDEGGLWPWSRLIAGAVILNVGVFVLSGKFPVIGRRPERFDGWSEDGKRAMVENPDYFLGWYTAKSLGLVVAVAVASFYIGKNSER